MAYLSFPPPLLFPLSLSLSLSLQGANFLYTRFILSYLKDHEEEIDANLESAQAKVYDKVMFYYNKAIAYAKDLLLQSIQYLPNSTSANGVDR